MISIGSPSSTCAGNYAPGPPFPMRIAVHVLCIFYFIVHILLAERNDGANNDAAFVVRPKPKPKDAVAEYMRADYVLSLCDLPGEC